MPVKRITITIRPDILKKMDKMIDKAAIRNRSHAAEQLILRGLSKTDLDTVVIMAGGDDARLRPITYEIPKPLIPIRGRPILEHQINMLKRFDIRNIILTVGKNYEKIAEYFGNGSKFGINLEYVIEKQATGTLGSLCFLKDRIKDTFGVLNVDTLVSPNIPDMYGFHKDQNTLATILLASVPDPHGFGVVSMRGSKILDFVEKPNKMQSHLVNCGFYILEPDIIKLIKRSRFMTQDLFKILAKENKLCGFLHDGDVFDVVTHEGYGKAIKQWRPVF